MSKSISLATHRAIQKAYDHLNKHIFAGELPQPILTLSYHRSAYGYFRNECFTDDNDSDKLDEISLNPWTFEDRTNEEILSTLAHEMVHLWQHTFGTPKKTHHDKEWASKMEEIGLMPSSTGLPGGKRTGRNVSHFIIDDETTAFKKAIKTIDFELEIIGKMGPKISKGSRRSKYTCPQCEVNAYGKKELSLICGSCNEQMEEQ